jgi:stage V sporulation protein D (sporulation-specific penicillin-binding protein)
MVKIRRSDVRLRARLLSAFVGCVAFVLIGNLAYLQIYTYDYYQDIVENQYQTSRYVGEKRGSIFFTYNDGRTISAASTQEGAHITVQPSKVPRAESVYEPLSKVLSLDREIFMKRMQRTDNRFIDIATQVTKQQLENIKSEDIPYIQFGTQYWRTYPGATLASHALGFLGIKESKREAQYGLELQYDSLLHRAPSQDTSTIFARMFNRSGPVVKGEGDVYTSIDPTLSIDLERILHEYQDAWHPEEVGALIMDPRTGEVLAMQALPTYDPNTYSNVENTSVYTNPLIQKRYEMGSIIKPIAMAAGLDAGVVTASTTYFDKGFVMKSGKKISNYDGKGRGAVTMQGVLSQSLNTGMSFVADRLGESRMRSYFTAFGLGQKTGIDIPFEINNDIRSLASGAEVDTASAAFGQGIALTPIATARALSVLANDGVLVKPHIAREVRFTDGTVERFDTGTSSRVISSESAREITRMLVEVVDTKLADGKVRQEHFSIAAKTGTAQIANKGGGGYDEGRYLHSFFGYFPAHKPQFLVFLYAVNPKGAKYSSQTWSKHFLDIVTLIIASYSVAPDR